MKPIKAIKDKATLQDHASLSFQQENVISLMFEEGDGDEEVREQLQVKVKT